MTDTPRMTIETLLPGLHIKCGARGATIFRGGQHAVLLTMTAQDLRQMAAELYALAEEWEPAPHPESPPEAPPRDPGKHDRDPAKSPYPEPPLPPQHVRMGDLEIT